jgi:hypothetical protein
MRRMRRRKVTKMLKMSEGQGTRLDSDWSLEVVELLRVVPRVQKQCLSAESMHCCLLSLTLSLTLCI